MPETISAMPDGPEADLTRPADGSWAHDGWAQITGHAGPAAALLTAALLGAITVYLLMRRPRRNDFSKHLMYVPLLLVNAAAIYGQIAFFYETVAPATWAVPGKLALSLLIAAAIESIAVYVGWHAHDALMMKASATAARLRRASYLIALVVGGINYAHFAGDDLAPSAASIAFGLLSLLSPWLWGLHTRRAQHVQLVNEGVIDAAGATFSAERMRMFPWRTYMARRWSVDHYVSDPQSAWEGYRTYAQQRRLTGPHSRVRLAWLALAGHTTVVDDGHDDPIRVDATTGQPTDTEPVTVTDSPALPAPDSSADVTTMTGPATRPDTLNGHQANTGPVTRTPARRARTRTPDRTPQWTKDQLKAFRLRDTRADMTYPLIAREVGVSEKTVSRWFQRREASENGDNAGQERPPLTLPIGEPQPVLAGVNGSPFHSQEN